MSALARATRTPLMWLVFAALLVLCLLGLERTGAAAPAGDLPGITPVSTSVQKHCTDGKGKDDTTSPSCYLS